MSKVTQAIRAREAARRAHQEAEVARGLGHVRLAPTKKATKAELEALAEVKE
jgi:hypothetical protein